MHDPLGEQVTRWYRGEAVAPIAVLGVGLLGMGLVTFLYGWDWYSHNFLIALQMQFVRAALLLVGAYMIIFNRRAGIGVRSDGVVVRSCLGRSQLLPWSQIEQFEAIRMPRSRPTHVIAVICRDRKPLYTFGCWFDKTSKSREKMHQVLRALEAERLAAAIQPTLPSR
jgi:hypothetical protein